jgi:hypothetical protein
MKSSPGLITAFLLITMITLACNKRYESTDETRSEPTPDLSMKTTTPVSIPTNEANRERMPGESPAPIIVLDATQRSYFLSIVSSIERVIGKQTSLDQEEATLLGEGLYYWPKDPTHPVKLSRYYPQENFNLRWLSLSFRRPASTSPWSEAHLTVHPSSFPLQVYDLQVSSDFYKNYNFERAALESRPHRRIEEPRVFYFVHKKLPHVRMRIETSPNVTSADSKYPSAFYSITFTAGDE